MPFKVRAPPRSPNPHTGRPDVWFQKSIATVIDPDWPIEPGHRSLSGVHRVEGALLTGRARRLTQLYALCVGETPKQATSPSLFSSV
jgi:hypothetical protein